MKLDVYKFTDPGGRDHNEDSIAARIFPDGALCAVADGLGGHKDGEIASQKVVDTFLSAEIPVDCKDGENWLAAQMEAANNALLSLQKELSSNMKSTAAVLLIQGRSAVWANVGDSRVYYLHGGAIVSITEDHSVAYRKYKAGEISRRQIAVDDDQPSLLRVLGNADRHAPAFHTSQFPLENGDGFLLCSDGMWEYVSDEEILIDFLKSQDAVQWGELLLLRVMNRLQPGHDNLSIITARILQEGDDP